MKLLHLADLHLGKRVNGFDLLEDQRAVLAQVLALCEEHGVQAVALAGDIYDTPVPPAGAVLLLDWFLSELCARGVAVLAVSGNHDSAERLDYAAGLLARQGVHIAGRFTGRVPVAVLADAAGPVEFCLLPFVRTAAVRHFLPDAAVTGYDTAVAAALATLPPRRPGVRRVLVAHQTVLAGKTPPACAGSESVAAALAPGREGPVIGMVEAVQAARFAENGGFDYVALGHIHRPQAVGSETVRYAGSLLSFSLDECAGGAAPQKSAVLADIAPGGVTVELLPLRPPHAMRRLTGPLAELTDPARVTGAQDYIWATLTDPTPQPDAMAALRAAYPNAMRLDYAPRAGAGGPGAPTAEALRQKSFAELFGGFFEQMQGRAMTAEEQTALQALQKEVGL